MTIKLSPFLMIGTLILLTIQSNGQFIDRASEWGIEHNYDGAGFGAAVSLVDINGDGKDDLTLGTGQGTSLAVYLQTDTGLTMLNEAGLLEITQAIRGLNWVDYDNDGDKDIFITYWNIFTGGGLSLYNQDEYGHFNEVTWAAGLIPANAPYYGSTWADYDNDGFLDLYICNYSTGTFGRNPMYHNNGDGTFTEVSVSMGVDDTQGYSFNSVFFDADMDGDLDLFVSNDRNAENRLYENQDNEDLEDVSALTGMNTILNAMGVELGDYDNDLDFDIYVTNTSGEFQGHVGNALFRNDGTSFEWTQGNPVEHSIGTYWGCNFLDFDFDRDLDLFTVNSNRVSEGYSRYFYVNDGSGTYSDYPGDEFQIENGNHYASAQGDLNSDGFIDLVVGDGILSTSQIWTGPPTNNHWIRIHLEGSISNRDGIGALIEVWADGVKRIDQTTCTSSHLAQDSNTYPFGLGNYPKADSVIVRWPSGVVNKVFDVPCEHRIHVLEDPEQETILCLPQVEWEVDVAEGLEQQFYFSTDEELTDVQWSIDGELVGMEDTLNIEFQSLGEYELCLSVSNSCTSLSWCESIAISCNTPPPSADWDLDLLTLSMQMDNVYDSLLWSLGDGEFTSEPSFVHTYDTVGVYTLCVIVYDICGNDSLCFEIETTCPPPIADFTWQIDGTELSAMSTSLNMDSSLWTWNGMPLSEDSTVSFNADPGLNELCLWVYNLCGTDSLCNSFDISPVGLPSLNGVPAFLLYPNPASELLHFQWSKELISPEIIHARDIQGRLIELVTSSQLSDARTLALDITHLDAGLYWLEVLWSNGEVSRSAFSKE